MGNEAEVPDNWLDDNDVTPLDPNDELNRDIQEGEPKDKRRAAVMHYINENRH